MRRYRVADARTSELASRTSNALLRLSDGCLPLLFLYVAALTTSAVLALGWGPLHHDMTEAWAWGKEFQLGYAKHPALCLPGSQGLWFAAMPRASWSF